MTYDVVVVGARCAGAPLATFLAREGARVLVVDRDCLPSDQVLSTHTIHPPGMDVLDELGVGDDVRSQAPPARTGRLRKGDAWADVTFADGRAEYCPRRERLDALLQDAARAAGAEIRDRTRVTEMLFDGGRAVGVRLERDGRGEEVRTGLVVGADGRRSTVAEAVGAEEYMGYDAPRAMYWAYWDAPDAWWTDEYPFDLYLGHVGRSFRVIFQTDGGCLLVGSLPPLEEARLWRRDAATALRDDLARDPVTGPLLAGADPAERVRGTIKERYFFRRATGPGWALAGDAGHHKEFCIGDGITEALIQARSLADAIGEGTDAALVRWWRARDVEALPGYFWGRDQGAPDRPGELETLIMRRVAADEDLQARMTLLPEHRATPYDVLPASAILPVLLRAVLRGRPGVIAEFVAHGRRAAEFRRRLKERRALLSEARAASA